jgi:hypothetical protein
MLRMLRFDISILQTCDVGCSVKEEGEEGPWC